MFTVFRDYVNTNTGQKNTILCGRKDSAEDAKNYIAHLVNVEFNLLNIQHLNPERVDFNDAVKIIFTRDTNKIYVVYRMTDEMSTTYLKVGSFV